METTKLRRFAQYARRTLLVMSFAAKLIWFRMEVNVPVAAGCPSIPSKMNVSSVMPNRESCACGVV